jgi:hypothetical protein
MTRVAWKPQWSETQICDDARGVEGCVLHRMDRTWLRKSDSAMFNGITAKGASLLVHSPNLTDWKFLPSETPRQRSHLLWRSVAKGLRAWQYYGRWSPRGGKIYRCRDKYRVTLQSLFELLSRRNISEITPSPRSGSSLSWRDVGMEADFVKG